LLPAEEVFVRAAAGKILRASPETLYGEKSLRVLRAWTLVCSGDERHRCKSLPHALHEILLPLLVEGLGSSP
jgi:hypothetical protein